MINQTALEELIGSSGLSMRQNSRSWIFTCPRCGKEDKLYMHKKGGRFVCWVCKETIGYQGQPEFALKDLLHRSLNDIKSLLYGDSAYAPAIPGMLVGQLRDYFGEDDEVEEEVEALVPVHWPHHFFPIDHKAAKRGLEYLQSRGIDADMARRYGCRYSPTDMRVGFPIAMGGVLYGWQARAIFNTRVEADNGDVFEVPKIQTPKGVRKDQMLMFADRLVGSEHAVVAEGPVDAIKADLCGGNVATMGKAVSQKQIGLLLNSGVKKIYLAQDPDAQAESRRLVAEFEGLRVFQLFPDKSSKDLGEMDPQAVLAEFQAAPEYTPGALIGRIITYEQQQLLIFKNAEREREMKARRGGKF